MNLFELSAKISVDDSNFKKSMENAQKVSKNVATAIKQLQSPLDKAKSGFNAIAHPVETVKANIEKLKNATESIRHPIETFKNKVAEASTALETKRNKLSTLAAGYDSAKKKVDDLTKEFNKSAKESGTSSQKTQELAKKLNEAENEAEEAKKELDDYSASVSKAGKNSDSASKGVGNFASKLGKGLATAGKVAGAALGVAATSITALTTAAVNNYAEYEQLVGGVDTLFKSSSQKVQEYAANAYKTAGMSANEYMSTVTSFSASLLQSLGGDTDKAAEYANQALIDMSDNANKMGTDIGMIQNAYQGFAKQNYTMLDNLKLGYGGTAQEMYRLLERAAELDETFAKTANFSIDSKGHLEAEFADITQAIHIVQTEMGITGTTADEAGRTISGSVGSMKSAWANLITGLADGNADIGQLVDNLVTTIVGDGTEKNLGVLGNIMPAVKTALGGAAKLVSKMIPELGKQLPGLIGDFLPMLLDSAVGLLNGLAKSLPELLPILIDSIILSAPAIIDGIVTVFESIVGALPDLIQQISDALPTLVPQIVVGLGLMAVALARQLPEIFASLVDGLINLFAGAWDGIQQVFSLDVVQDFFSDVWDGIKKAFGAVGDWFRNIFADAWEGVKNVFSSGGKIFQGITDGISGAFKTVVNAIIKGINNVVAWPFDKINGFLNKIRNVSFLGISPFKGFWKQNPLPVPQIPLLARGGVLEKGQVGLLEGTGAEAVVPLENNQKWISKVADDLKKSVGGFGGNVYNVEINIDGAKYSDEQSLARAVAEEIQSMTDRRAAVYA